MGLGFLASIMHLGSPMRAFNSLNRVGASALSNEIAAGSVFFAVGGIWWLVAVLGKMPPALGKVWLLVSMAFGVAFIWAMTLVYQIDTVPTWYNGYTTLAFFLTAFLCGPVFAALLLRIARVPFCSVTFASISGLALVVCVAVIVLQGLSLSTIHSSVQQASHLAPDYGMLQVWRIVLLAAGLGCWLCPLIRRREPHTVGLLLGVVLVLAGEIIGRGLFLWPAYDRRYGRRRLIYACGATRTFRDCLNDHFFLQRDDFAVTARVLGALFYYSPESHETAPLVQALLTDDWQAQWPLDAEALAPVAAMFKTHSEESLPQAWQRLFIGPYALPSPPWGSVWLDRESVLFGDSTLALRQWMRENGIQFEMQQNEPEDHFGSLLLLAAWLAENDRHHECEQLLAWHLFPWSSRFLDVFIDHAGHPFYQALGQLARLTLAQWQAQLIIPVAVKPLFR